MGFNYHSKTEGNSDQQFSCHGKLENVGGNSDQQFSSYGTLAMPIPKPQVGYNGLSTD